MAVRPVVVWPDARLREPTQPISAITDDVRALYRDLADTMAAENGLGIAAIQIGEPHRMFLIEAELAGREKGAPPVACINPHITMTSTETQLSDEGCLSFPQVYIQVERPLRTTLVATDLDGKQFELQGEGLLARCILHEFDHLNGKLLADFMGTLKRQMVKKKLLKVQAERAEEAADAKRQGIL